MTLEEAIKHCNDKVKELGCTECGKEHQQLLEWLKELKEIKDNKKSKMTAKEMFKELGYTDIEKDKYVLTYTDNTLADILGENCCKTIAFYLDTQSVSCFLADDNGFHNADVYSGEVNAIQKQIEELGW